MQSVHPREPVRVSTSAPFALEHARRASCASSDPYSGRVSQRAASRHNSFVSAAVFLSAAAGSEFA
jgi:hypothetical protein